MIKVITRKGKGKGYQSQRGRTSHDDRAQRGNRQSNLIIGMARLAHMFMKRIESSLWSSGTSAQRIPQVVCRSVQ